MSNRAPTSGDGELRLDRKKLLKVSAAAAATPAVAGIVAKGARAGHGRPFRDLEEATIAELQEAMTNGQLDARRLVRAYLKRIDAIDRNGPKLNSILELTRMPRRSPGTSTASARTVMFAGRCTASRSC